MSHSQVLPACRSAPAVSPNPQALIEMEGALRSALPDASFAEREAAALAISDEAVRSLLENDLRTLSASFGDQVLIDACSISATSQKTGRTIAYPDPCTCHATVSAKWAFTTAPS